MSDSSSVTLPTPPTSIPSSTPAKVVTNPLKVQVCPRQQYAIGDP